MLLHSYYVFPSFHIMLWYYMFPWSQVPKLWTPPQFFLDPPLRAYFTRVAFGTVVKKLLCHCCIHSCYYTARVCKYFLDGECYENYTPNSNASACKAVGGFLLRGSCYYHVQRTCSAGEYLLECTCYRNRSTTYSNNTCINIDGYYADNYCYYVDFNCSRYAVNDQCYTRVNSLRNIMFLFLRHKSNFFALFSRLI